MLPQSEKDEHATCPKDRRLSWMLALDDAAPSAKSLTTALMSISSWYVRFREMREQSTDPKGYGRRRRWGSTCAGRRRRNGEEKRSIINMLDRRFVKRHRPETSAPGMWAVSTGVVGKGMSVVELCRPKSSRACVCILVDDTVHARRLFGWEAWHWTHRLEGRKREERGARKRSTSQTTAHQLRARKEEQIRELGNVARHRGPTD
jgi:hypothetical protein